MIASLVIGTAAASIIAATFEEVRRIATGYGVEMPIPPAEAANTI